MSQATTKTIWMPVPGYAVPVRVVMEQRDELDSLSRAILGLLEVEPRTVSLLADMLGFSEAEDLVVGALARLQDRGFVQVCEGGSSLYEATEIAREEKTGTRVHPGWVFLLPQRPRELRVLPQVYFGEALPASIDKEKLLERGLTPDRGFDFHPFYQAEAGSRSLSGKKQVDLALQKLTRNKKIEFIEATEVKKSTQGGSEPVSLELPKLSSVERTGRIRKIEFDEVRAKRFRRLVWTNFWMQVDLMPRISQPATMVCHRPIYSLKPEAKKDGAPIDLSYQRWLEHQNELQELWLHLEQMAREMQKEFSLVLKEANIESSAELENLVISHKRDLERRHRKSLYQENGGWVLGKRLREMTLEAWRWRILGRRAEEYLPVARDKYAHLIEALAKALREQAAGDLREWHKSWKGLGKSERQPFFDKWANEGWLRDRLGIVGITPDELKPSYQHVRNSLKNRDQVKKVVAAIESLDGQGAGNSIALWLLPLFLSDDEEAQAYGAPIQRSIDEERFLIEEIDVLINVRNENFHQRGNSHALEDVDRKIFKVLAALERGYARPAS